MSSSADPFFDARRTVHRRSRSFSELINSSNSMFSAAPSPGLPATQTRNREIDEQPWRSREAWTALHALPSALGSSPLLPSAMGDTGGWKGRGGGAFFGADMKGMLPGRQRKGRGRRNGGGEDMYPSEKMDEWVVVEEEEVESASPATTPTRLAFPSEPGLLAPSTPMSRRKTRSAYNIRDSTLGHPPSSSSSDDRWDVEVHTPTFDDSDDDSLLPPLLPYASSSRAGSFTSLPDSPPIPWGRASPVPSIRTPTLAARAPPFPRSPRTPTRQTTSPLSLVSRGTPKTWTPATPSPPRRSRPILSPRGSHESEPPRTPTRHRPEVVRSATSPQMVKFDLRDLREKDEKGGGVPVMPKASPSKFWSAPRGWAEKKKVEGEGDKAWRGLLFRQARAGAA
ncbi:hypothetical protein IAT38_002347 [Cryptococcus sp. DSM 104549]